MEGLVGDMGTMPVADLLLYLGNRKLTGTLSCESGSAKKSLHVKEGAVVSVGSNDPREYLGQFLITFGHLSEDQLTRAFQTQAEHKVPLGRLLVMAGLVTEQAMQEVLVVKIRETALSVCRFKEGTFRFARGELPASQDGVEANVSLLDIHREAGAREAAWKAMLQAFPHAGLTFAIVDEAKLPREPDAGGLDARLIELVREGNNIEEISLRLHATDFQLYQRLYALYRQGAIAPREPAPKEASAAQAGGGTVGEEIGAQTGDIVRHVREFLDQKRFADAQTLAQRAVELSPGPQTQALLREAEASLLEELREELIRRSPRPRRSPSRPPSSRSSTSPLRRSICCRASTATAT